MTEGQISMSSQGPAAQIGASSGADLAGLIEGYSQRVDLVRRQLGQVIFGQEETVEQALISILSGGHGMLVIAHLPFCSVHRTACNKSDRSQAVPTTTVPAALTASASLPLPNEGSAVSVANPLEVLPA